jgi:hypothetical protein
MLEGYACAKEWGPSVSGRWAQAELLDEAFRPVTKGSAILVSASEGIFRPNAPSPFPEKISLVTTLLFASAIQLSIVNLEWKDDILRFTIELSPNK